MTISVFDTYLYGIHMARSKHMMDISQATFYSQLTREARRSLWNSWSNTVSEIKTIFVRTDAMKAGRSLFTWNGDIVTVKQLKDKFRSTFGKRSVVA